MRGQERVTRDAGERGFVLVQGAGDIGEFAGGGEFLDVGEFFRQRFRHHGADAQVEEFHDDERHGDERTDDHRQHEPAAGLKEMPDAVQGFPERGFGQQEGVFSEREIHR